MSVKIPLVKCCATDSGLVNAFFGWSSCIATIGYVFSTDIFDALSNDSWNVGPQIASFALLIVAILIGLVTFIIHATKFKSSSGVMPAKTWKMFAAMYFLSFIFMCGGWLWFIPIKLDVGYGFTYEVQLDFAWGHGVLIEAMVNTLIAAMSTFNAAKQVGSSIAPSTA